jgi:hypothetical protein
MSPQVATGRGPGEAVRVARAVLSADIGVLEACVSLASLGHDVVPDWRLDPDFCVFGAVASEVDALPLGAVRAQWSCAALAKADVEIARYTRLVEDRVFVACRNIVERFDTPRQVVPSNNSLERTRDE